MNTFIVNRPTPGGVATKEKIIDDKIPIYDSKADAEADLANIEEGGIVATKDTGATEKVVDVVEDGNMNPVTSNGVFDFISSLSGYAQVGGWKLIRLGSSNFYLGLYYNNNIAPNNSSYDVSFPNGYTYVQHYFGQCFQEGNTRNVTGAVHAATNAVRVYFTGDATTGYNYDIRVCCLFQKNS